MAKPENLRVGVRVVPKFGPYGPGVITHLPSEETMHWYQIKHDNGMVDSSPLPGSAWDAENLRLLDKKRKNR